MEQKTREELIAEIEQLKSWRAAAIKQQSAWLAWAEQLLQEHGRDTVGRSIHLETVELVRDLSGIKTIAEDLARIIRNSEMSKQRSLSDGK
jgi:hypothetical protein